MKLQSKSNLRSQICVAVVSLVTANVTFVTGSLAQQGNQPKNDDHVDPETRITVQDSGTKPRTLGFLDITSDRSREYRINTRDRSENTIDGAKQADKTDSNSYTLAVSITPQKVTRFLDAKVQVRDSSFKEIVGLSDNAQIGSNWAILSAPFREPTQDDFTLKTYARRVGMLFKEFNIPFPQEPIGSDARWTVTQDYVDFRGIQIKRTLDCKLESTADADFKVAVTVVEEAGPQKLTRSELAAGESMHLLSLRLTGTISATIRKSDCLPVHAKLKEHVELAMRHSGSGFNQSRVSTVEKEYELRKVEGKK